MNPKARQEDLLIEELVDELVIYDRRKRRAHRLNGVAALMWRSCDGQRSVRDLAGVLKQETSLPADEGVVLLALDRLSKANLLETRLDSASTAGLSRRQLVRKFGMTGAAALLLPVVASLAAPTPAMASSNAGLIDCSMKICLKNLDCVNASNGQCTKCTSIPDTANPDVYICAP